MVNSTTAKHLINTEPQAATYGTLEPYQQVLQYLTPAQQHLASLKVHFQEATSLSLNNQAQPATLTASASAQCAIDVFNGQNAFNLTGLSGTRAYGPQGEYLYYSIGRANTNSPFTYLLQQNNTKLPGIEAAAGITAWGPGKRNYNMSSSYDCNVTLSSPIANTITPIGSVGGFGGTGTFNATTQLYTIYPTILYVFPGNLIFGQSSGLQTIPGTSAGIFGTPDPFTSMGN